MKSLGNRLGILEVFLRGDVFEKDRNGIPARIALECLQEAVAIAEALDELGMTDDERALLVRSGEFVTTQLPAPVAIGPNATYGPIINRKDFETLVERVRANKPATDMAAKIRELALAVIVARFRPGSSWEELKDAIAALADVVDPEGKVSGLQPLTPTAPTTTPSPPATTTPAPQSQPGAKTK